jgi:hypothetical protein
VRRCGAEGVERGPAYRDGHRWATPIRSSLAAILGADPAARAWGSRRRTWRTCENAVEALLHRRVYRPHQPRQRPSLVQQLAAALRLASVLRNERSGRRRGQRNGGGSRPRRRDLERHPPLASGSTSTAVCRAPASAWSTPSAMTNRPPTAQGERHPSARRPAHRPGARARRLPLHPPRAQPASRGFLPRVRATQSFQRLRPAEELARITSRAVPFERRVLDGFLAREGCRLSEALSLRWRGRRRAAATARHHEDRRAAHRGDATTSPSGWLGRTRLGGGRASCSKKPRSAGSSPKLRRRPFPLRRRLVAPAGLEPASPFGRGILSPLRLPFRQGAACGTVACRTPEGVYTTNTLRCWAR